MDSKILICIVFMVIVIAGSEALECYDCDSIVDEGCGATVSTSNHSTVECNADEKCELSVSDYGSGMIYRRECSWACSRSSFSGTQKYCCNEDGCNIDTNTASIEPFGALKCYQCSDAGGVITCNSGSLSACLDGEQYCEKTTVRAGGQTVISKSCSHTCQESSVSAFGQSVKVNCCKKDGCNTAQGIHVGIRDVIALSIVGYFVLKIMN